jgi:hypothetical protein
MSSCATAGIQQIKFEVATMGIDISKCAFHVFGLDRRGAIARCG